MSLLKLNKKTRKVGHGEAVLESATDLRAFMVFGRSDMLAVVICEAAIGM